MKIYCDVNEDIIVGIESSDDAEITKILEECFGYEFIEYDNQTLYDAIGTFDLDTVVVTSNLVDEDFIATLIENKLNLYITAI